MAQSVNEFLTPRHIDVQELSADARTRDARAARARLRSHAGQHAAAHPAVVDARLRDHGGADRRRAARVQHDGRRAGGRDRHPAEPEGRRDHAAQRRRSDRSRCRRKAARARSRPATSSSRETSKSSNRDHLICTLNDNGAISMEVKITRGRGYEPVENREEVEEEESRPIGVLRLDATYSPMRRVCVHGRERARRTAHRPRQADPRSRNERHDRSGRSDPPRGDDPAAAARGVRRSRKRRRTG